MFIDPELYHLFNICNILKQITEDSVRLVDGNSLELVSEWKDEHGSAITVAAANQTQVVVAARGGKLFYVDITPGKLIQRT